MFCKGMDHSFKCCLVGRTSEYHQTISFGGRIWMLLVTKIEVCFTEWQREALIRVPPRKTEGK